MGVKETVASLAAKRGYLISEVAEEMSERGYEGEAQAVLRGEAEGCYICAALLRDILDLDAAEMKALHIAFMEGFYSWSSSA